MRRWGNMKPPTGLAYLDWSDPINQGIVSCWLLGEGGGTTAFDSCKLNNGTLTNFGMTATSGWAPGKFGTALAFDGINDYLATSNTTNSISNLTKYAISVWFKTSAASGTDGRMYAEGSTSTNTPVAFVTYGFAGTEITFFHRDDANVSINQGSSSTGLNNGTWHHAVCVRNGSTFTVYVDGVSSGSSTATIGTTTINKISIGAHERASVVAFFPGIIENVRTYSRALLSSEVSRLFYEPFAGFAVPRRKVFPSAGGVPWVYAAIARRWGAAA